MVLATQLFASAGRLRSVRVVPSGTLLSRAWKAQRLLFHSTLLKVIESNDVSTKVSAIPAAEGTAGVIEIRLRELAQLFNTLDPSPFHERDLDDDAEAYITGWARELPWDLPLHIIFHLPETEALKARQRGLSQALNNYFAERAAMLDRDLKELFRAGWRYLSIGLPVLALCLFASQMARTAIPSVPLARAVEESLIIVGWVANWKPIETFLYDWWPVKRRRDLYRRLSQATIEINAR